MPKLIATLMSLSISSSPPEHVHAVPHITSNSPAAKAPTFPPNPPSALLHPAITIHPHPLLLHSEHRTSARGTFSYPSTIPQRHKSFPSQSSQAREPHPCKTHPHKKQPIKRHPPLSRQTHFPKRPTFPMCVRRCGPHLFPPPHPPQKNPHSPGVSSSVPTHPDQNTTAKKGNFFEQREKREHPDARAAVPGAGTEENKRKSRFEH